MSLIYYSFFIPRSCTDVVCCIIFIAVILGYIALGTVGKFDTLLPQIVIEAVYIILNVMMSSF